MPEQITFKRVPVGQTFLSRLGRFRKVSEKHVYAVNANGRGQTHKKLPFARSVLCALI